MSIYGILKSWASSTVGLKYGRNVIRDLVVETHHDRQGDLHVLDIGCAACGDLLNIQSALKDRKVILHGLDFRPKEFYGITADIDFKTCNIESEPLPFPDASMDYVICNQIYEHCKEIFFLTSEIARVLKPGGKAVIGVPNLSSLHSLVMLLLGRQPPPVLVVGPHVRGFCVNGLNDLFEFAGTFHTIAVRGSGFYPFPTPVAKLLAKVFPKYAVSLFGLYEKKGSPADYLATLQKIPVESSFKGWTY